MWMERSVFYKHHSWNVNCANDAWPNTEGKDQMKWHIGTLLHSGWAFDSKSKYFGSDPDHLIFCMPHIQVHTITDCGEGLSVLGLSDRRV